MDFRLLSLKLKRYVRWWGEWMGWKSFWISLATYSKKFVFFCIFLILLTLECELWIYSEEITIDFTWICAVHIRWIICSVTIKLLDVSLIIIYDALLDLLLDFLVHSSYSRDASLFKYTTHMLNAWLDFQVECIIIHTGFRWFTVWFTLHCCCERRNWS